MSDNSSELTKLAGFIGEQAVEPFLQPRDGYLLIVLRFPEQLKTSPVPLAFSSNMENVNDVLFTLRVLTAQLEATAKANPENKQ